MGKEVKVIADKLNDGEINLIQQYIKNLKQIFNDDFSVTILDSSYNTDYRYLLKVYGEIISKFPGIKINNFYIDYYLKSQKKNNINTFTTEYMKNEQFTAEERKDGQRVFLKDGQVRVAINTNKSGSVTDVDFFQQNQKNPHQKAFINSNGNIQMLRYFNVKKKIIVKDEYLDTELMPFILLRFDKKGLCSSYEFVNEKTQKFYSQVDLYEQWFSKVIKDDDYIINLNRHFDIVFRQKRNVDRIFLM